VDECKPLVGGTPMIISGAEDNVLPKPIFVLSDCTGESAANTCRSALGQFEQWMAGAYTSPLFGST